MALDLKAPPNCAKLEDLHSRREPGTIPFPVNVQSVTELEKVKLRALRVSRQETTRPPVRSALFKQRTGELVVRWTTTSEYPLLYV